MRHGLSPVTGRGVLFGEAPYGWRLTRDRTRLVVDTAEQRVIAIVRHMHARGLSIRAIVSELRDIGVVNRRGRPFSVTRVFRILRSRPKTPKEAKRRA